MYRTRGAPIGYLCEPTVGVSEAWVARVRERRPQQRRSGSGGNWRLLIGRCERGCGGCTVGVSRWWVQVRKSHLHSTGGFCNRLVGEPVARVLACATAGRRGILINTSPGKKKFLEYA